MVSDQSGASGFITTVSPQIEPVRNHSIVGTIGSMSNMGPTIGGSTVTASGIATVPVGTAETKQQSRKKSVL